MRHALVRALVLHYLDQFGYKGPRVRVYTRPSRLTKRHRVTVERGEWGSCTPTKRSLVIFINLDHHDTLGQLLDTCAHEALHGAGRNHGLRFDAEIAETVLA